VLQNRVLRKIFGSEREKVTIGWREVLNKEVHNKDCSSSIIG
jgi:hypothetical protein